MFRFFFYGDNLTGFIKFYDTEALRIIDIVAENAGPGPGSSAFLTAAVRIFVNPFP